LLAKLHRGAGLLAGAFLVFQGLSGALLLYRDALERQARPIPARIEALGRQPLPLQSLLDRQAPARVTFLSFPAREAAPVEAFLTRGNQTEFVALDPYTGRNLGPLRGGDDAAWLRPIARYHFKFFPQALAAALLLLLCTGLLQREKRSLHARLGLFAALPLVLYSISALLIVYARPTALPPPQTTAQPLAPADTLLAAARRAVPGARLSYISLSPTVVSARLHAPGDPRAYGNTDVHLHPATAALLRLDRFEAAPWRTRAYHYLAALHFGELGWKPLYLPLGLTPLLLLLSALQARRRNRPARS